jgi:hypothetical protein
LEAVVQKLEQENKDLEAQVELFKANKELAIKANDGKVGELEAEVNALTLRNYCMNYNLRQSEARLAEEREKCEESEARLSHMTQSGDRQSLLDRDMLLAKDEQLAEARVRIADLESSNVEWMTDGPNRFAQLYKERTCLFPDQWKDLVKSFIPKHHAVLADLKEVQVQCQGLQQTQNQLDSALREAQTEAWTMKHLHEEVCRTLEVSQQMHKAANECAAISAAKLEALETRSAMHQQVTERMVADAWQANASKDERIKLLAADLPSMHLKHLLDDRMVELSDVNGRLVVTQRLVEQLNDQLAAAKKEQGEVELDNRKLECQLGEAKVRLDHDYQDEERLKAELDQARAAVEEYKQSAEHWQHIAVAELDKQAPDAIGQLKQETLVILQEKLEEADSQMKDLLEYNEGLEVHLNDLEYELGINERRLALDESIKIDFYERHWRTVEKVFDENKFKTAMIRALEGRFAEELSRNPLETPTVSGETFEDYAGPEFIDRANALYRFTDQAQEERGQNDLRHSDLDKERIKAIYGHGPAGYKPRPQKEIPEGYAERKAAREITDLRWKVKELRGRLWRYGIDANNNLVTQGECEAEGELEADAIREWEIEANNMRRVGFLNSI